MAKGDTPIAAQPPVTPPPTKQEPSGAIKVFRRFVGGTVGGVFQALCSHPFDTIKSRMQQGLAPSVKDCVASMYHKEGVRGFYRGVTPPLAIMGTYNAVLFSVNQGMTLLVTPKDHPKDKPLPMWRVAVAAQMTAPICVAVLTPMEVVKVQLQVQPVGEGRLFTGPVDCAVKLIKKDGLKTLIRGYWPTVGSRLVGLPFYFLGYEAVRKYLSEGHEKPPEYVQPVAGACAGISFWTTCYPFDFTKTKVQATGRTAVDVVTTTFTNEGVKGLYRGFMPCMLRAVPANASVWFGMDKTIKAMEAAGW